jgi:hypothetical protein
MFGCDQNHVQHQKQQKECPLHKALPPTSQRLKPGTLSLLGSRTEAVPFPVRVHRSVELPRFSQRTRETGHPESGCDGIQEQQKGRQTPVWVSHLLSNTDSRGGCRYVGCFRRCQASLYFSYFAFLECGVRRISGWLWVAFRGRMYQVLVGITYAAKKSIWVGR